MCFFLHLLKLLTHWTTDIHKQIQLLQQTASQELSHCSTSLCAPQAYHFYLMMGVDWIRSQAKGKKKDRTAESTTRVWEWGAESTYHAA